MAEYLAVNLADGERERGEQQAAEERNDQEGNKGSISARKVQMHYASDKHGLESLNSDPDRAFNHGHSGPQSITLSARRSAADKLAGAGLRPSAYFHQQEQPPRVRPRECTAVVSVSRLCPSMGHLNYPTFLRFSWENSA